MAIITNLQPPAGATVGPSTPLSFDVIDPVISQLRVFVWIVFKATGTVELAYDGNAWQALYGFSTIDSIPGGRRFTVTRVGGWPSAPEVRVDSCACPPELGDGGTPGLTPYTVGPEEVGAPYQSLQEAIDAAEADGFGTNGTLGLPAFIYVLPGWANLEDVTIPDGNFYIIGTSSWTQTIFNGESSTASLSGTVTVDGRSAGGRTSGAVVRWEGVDVIPSTPGNAAFILDGSSGSAVLSIAKCLVRPRGPMVTDTPADGQWLIMLDDVVWGGSLSTPSTIAQDFQARDSVMITETTFAGVSGEIIDIVLERCRVRAPVAAVSASFTVNYRAKDCLFDNTASFAAGGAGVSAIFINCHSANSFTLFEYIPSTGLPVIDLDQCTHGSLDAASRASTLPQTFGYPDPDTETEAHVPAIVEWRRRANLLTANATPADILIADTFNRFFSGSVLVKGWVTAKIAAGGDRSSYWREFEALYDCNSGVTTLVGGSLVLGAEFRTGTLTTCTSNLAVVGDQVVVQVTGEAATNIQWVVIYEIVSRP